MLFYTLHKIYTFRFFEKLVNYCKTFNFCNYLRKSIKSSQNTHIAQHIHSFIHSVNLIYSSSLSSFNFLAYSYQNKCQWTSWIWQWSDYAFDKMPNIHTFRNITPHMSISVKKWGSLAPKKLLHDKSDTISIQRNENNAQPFSKYDTMSHLISISIDHNAALICLHHGWTLLIFLFCYIVMAVAIIKYYLKTNYLLHRPTNWPLQIWPP